MMFKPHYILISLWVSEATPAFVSSPNHSRGNPIEGDRIRTRALIGPLSLRGGGFAEARDLTKQYLAVNPAVASVVAGSIAGAIGVGIAFPLDTLKTKSQVLGQANGNLDVKSVGGSAAGLSSREETNDLGNVAQMSMFQLIRLIYRLEGISGFFGGVKGMMIGQALIKSLAFSANASALVFLNENMPILPSVAALLGAACFAGFVTSFIVTPIERVKVLMQASNRYKNEFNCLSSIIQNDGIHGVFSRGLGPTLAREVPSYGIYFLIYGLLMQLPVADAMGQFAPLVFGAFTGMASWIPVYPIDVVKTIVQNSDGSDHADPIEVAKKLYQERGIEAFFDGLTPKMLRAAVNHSVTFYVYSLIMDMMKV